MAPRLSPARNAVHRAVIAAGKPATVTELADQLGQHQNTVREHLDKLIADGLVERLRSRPDGRGRPAWLYQAVGPASTDAGDGTWESGGHEYASLALALIEQVTSSNPDPRGMARQAGERWGRTLAQQRLDRDHLMQRDDTAPEAASPATADPAATIVEMFSALRFTPEPASAPYSHRLTTCPLLEAARRNTDVVCGVHLGIVRGALDRLGGDPDGAALEPFAQPGACLLRLPSPG